MISEMYEENNTSQVFVAQLYYKYSKLAYYVVGHYIESESDREDVVHDTFLKLIPKTELLQEMNETVLRTYVITTARNTAITRAKQNAKKKEQQISSDPEEMLLNVADSIGALDELMIQREQTNRIQEVVNKLSPEDRFLIDAKYILGCSDADIAVELGVKASSVRMMLTRTRRKILQQMIDID